MSTVKGVNPVKTGTVADNVKRITLDIIGRVLGAMTGKYACAGRPNNTLYSQGLTDSANFTDEGRFIGVDCMGIAPTGESVKYTLSVESMPFVFGEDGTKFYIEVKMWPSVILTREQFRAKSESV